MVNCIDNLKLDLIKKVRMLWMQHSEWTRMAFTSTIFSNSDKDATIERLLRNPMDFADFLRIYYGDEVAYKFCNLLTEHLSLAVRLVEATMDEDTKKADKIDRRLYENADEITALLDCINPYWDYYTWRAMFYKHLDLAKMMATERIDGNYKKSVKTYDKFEKEVMIMADMMAEGILEQFHDMFY